MLFPWNAGRKERSQGVELRPITQSQNKKGEADDRGWVLVALFSFAARIFSDFAPVESAGESRCSGIN
jgi:hypothetical protein